MTVGTPPRISPAELRKALAGNAEIAVIDVRENGVHGRDGHPLLSVSLPLSRLELEIARAVPRLATEIVVFDGGDGKLAERAVRRLAELGYREVKLLAGGVEAWRDAGYEVFTGAHVVSIAFGEFVEEVYGTPHISAGELKARLDRADNVVVLDSRTIPEFRNFSIPGAIDLPGAELVYRFHEAVPDPDTLVVVNCAGRTRSIIGAQALINAGVPNRVLSLANGTMDWLINGFGLEEGSFNFPGRPAGGALAAAKATRDRLRQRFPVATISRSELARFQADASRSLYLLDVRTEEEFLKGHVPGARWAEGGQLVQQLGRWVGTQNSRIVLADSEDLVRATITASWLLQINWAEVFVLEHEAGAPVELGPEPVRLAASLPPVDPIEPFVLSNGLVRGGFTIVDLDTSVAYRAGHLPGAIFAIRERLAADAGRLPGEGPIVLASPDGRLAAFAAEELQRSTDRPVQVLAGGTAAWKRLGLDLETGEGVFFHPAEDAHLTAYQLPPDQRFAAFRRYLDWEVGLVAQLKRDGTSKYRVFPPDAEAAAAAE